MNEHQRPADFLAEIARQAMIDRGLEPDYPNNALQQLASISGPAKESGNGIRDMRDLPWCSIDNDDSRDLDQLTWAEKKGAATRVLVAVADVDAVVKKDTPLDGHAHTNTTSVYTAARIFAMLPEKLSTDLTSLNQAEDRLAMTRLAAEALDRIEVSDAELRREGPSYTVDTLGELRDAHPDA